MSGRFSDENHFILKNGTWVRNHHVYSDECEHCYQIKELEAKGYRLKSEKKIQTDHHTQLIFEFDSGN